MGAKMQNTLDDFFKDAILSNEFEIAYKILEQAKPTLTKPQYDQYETKLDTEYIKYITAQK